MYLLSINSVKYSDVSVCTSYDVRQKLFHKRLERYGSRGLLGGTPVWDIDFRSFSCVPLNAGAASNGLAGKDRCVLMFCTYKNGGYSQVSQQTLSRTWYDLIIVILPNDGNF